MKLSQLTEMPWVDVGSRIIDLKLEKEQSRENVLQKIDNVYHKLSVPEQKAFKKDLQTTYGSVLTHFNITIDQIK